MERKRHRNVGHRFKNAKQASSYESEAVEERVQELFSKCLSLVERSEFVLPPPEEMFKTAPWMFEPLQKLKAELNSVKNLLNGYNLDDWQSHTSYRNSAKDVMRRVRAEIQPEFVTQAWCKFYEIVSSYPLVPLALISRRDNRFKSVHLCEAPGAFVASLNHWLRTNAANVRWDWVATTLNPYYEGHPLSMMIDDDRFIQHTLNNWCFGEDNTGNLMTDKNLDALLSFCEPCEDILLVTADGSINCIDVPGEQENVVAHLHFCETVAALCLLAAGGSFLLKVFTTFEHHSVCLLYFLSCCFESIDIVKPATSKEGNSETYVVCTQFKGRGSVSAHLDTLRKYYVSGPTKAMFSLDDLPPVFLSKIVQCSEFFKVHQCSVITNNIQTFAQRNGHALSKLKRVQCAVADRYLRQYKLSQLSSGEIVGKKLLAKANSISTCRKMLQEESYDQRCKKQSLSLVERLTQYINHANQIEIRISPNKPIAFQIDKLPELTITLGRKFDKVHSSRFCSAEILRIKSCIDSITEQLDRKIQLPPIEQTEEPVSDQHTISFDPNEHYDSHKVIEVLCDRLQGFQSADTLVLVNYPLLTHFNVGLLYLIGYSFDSLEIELCDNVGSKISLRGYTCQTKVQKALIDVQTASRTAIDQDKIVLGIYPASFFYETDLYPAIVDVNHWIIKLHANFVRS